MSQQKAGLNKAILDQGWGMFRRMLEYKQAWRGGEVIAVNPRYTSQTCPECGHVSKANRPQQALFSCEQCGYSYHADVVAAIEYPRPGAQGEAKRLLAPLGATGIPGLQAGEDVNIQPQRTPSPPTPCAEPVAIQAT